jgi:hypothetical protein
MFSAIRTFRRQFQFCLLSDRLDFGGDAANISYRTLNDIGLIRGGYAPRPDKYWLN